jgi:hypothetical protein
MDPEYFVYYDRANTRPRKHFGQDHRGAMAWAQENADKNTQVVECQTVWSARNQQACR